MKCQGDQREGDNKLERESNNKINNEVPGGPKRRGQQVREGIK